MHRSLEPSTMQVIIVWSGPSGSGVGVLCLASHARDIENIESLSQEANTLEARRWGVGANI